MNIFALVLSYQGVDKLEFVLLQFHLNLLNLGFKFLYFTIYLPEPTALVAFFELFLKGELLETLLTFPADLDDLRGESFDEAEELEKGVVCVADNKYRSL
jgi:hypothetical protein